MLKQGAASLRQPKRVPPTFVNLPRRRAPPRPAAAWGSGARTGQRDQVADNGQRLRLHGRVVARERLLARHGGRHERRVRLADRLARRACPAAHPAGLPACPAIAFPPRLQPRGPCRPASMLRKMFFSVMKLLFMHACISLSKQQRLGATSRPPAGASAGTACGWQAPAGRAAHACAGPRRRGCRTCACLEQECTGETPTALRACRTQPAASSAHTGTLSYPQPCPGPEAGSGRTRAE